MKKHPVLITIVVFLYLASFPVLSLAQGGILKTGPIETYRERGKAYFLKGDYDGAISQLNEVLKINPKDEKSYYNRGVAYFLKGDHDKAIIEFNKTIEILNSKNIKVYFRRGIIYNSSFAPSNGV